MRTGVHLVHTLTSEGKPLAVSGGGRTVPKGCTSMSMLRLTPCCVQSCACWYVAFEVVLLHERFNTRTLGGSKVQARMEARMTSIADVLHWYQLWLRCVLTGKPTVLEYHVQIRDTMMAAIGLTRHDTLYAIVNGQLTQVYPVPQAPTQSPQKKQKPTLTLVYSRDD